jgi:hypothetical protein
MLDQDFNTAFRSLIYFKLDGNSMREWLRRELTTNLNEIQKLETFDTYV